MTLRELLSGRQHIWKRRPTFKELQYRRAGGHEAPQGHLKGRLKPKATLREHPRVGGYRRDPLESSWRLCKRGGSRNKPSHACAP
jgi:hypothetical protein